MKSELILTREEIIILIKKHEKEYPASLNAKDLARFFGYKKPNQMYTLIHSLSMSRKIPGIGWRVPADTFFYWYYGIEVEERDLAE